MVQIAREIFKTLLAPSLSVRNPDEKEPKIAMIAEKAKKLMTSESEKPIAFLA